MKAEWIIKAGNWAVKNRRTILTVGSITGVVITIAVTAKESIKWKEEIDILEKDFQDNCLDEKAYKKEKVIITAKHAIGPVLCGAATSVAIGTNQKFATEEIADTTKKLAAAVASADYISDKYNKLEEKIKEKSPEALKQAKKEMAQKKLEEDVQSGRVSKDCIKQVGQGQTLYLDEQSGQLFRSSEGELRELARTFNMELKGSDWLSENYRLQHFSLNRMGELGDYYGYREYYESDGLTLDFEGGDYIPAIGETPTIMIINEHLCTEGDFRSIECTY